MASIRFRGSKWQARISRLGEQSQVKTFQTKEDAERWASIWRHKDDDGPARSHYASL